MTTLPDFRGPVFLLVHAHAAMAGIDEARPMVDHEHGALPMLCAMHHLFELLQGEAA